MNVERFQRLLEREGDPEKRSRIEKLLAEERVKPDTAYPPESLSGPRAPNDRPSDTGQRDRA